MGFFNKLFGKKASPEKAPEPAFRCSLKISDELSAMQNRLTSRMITNLRDKPTIGLSGFFGIAASLALCRVMIPVSVDISDKDAAAMLSGQKTVTTVNDIKMKPITTKNSAGCKNYTAYLSKKDIPDDVYRANSWIKADFPELVKLAAAEPGSVITINPGSLNYDVTEKQFIFILNAPADKPVSHVNKTEQHYSYSNNKDYSAIKLELAENTPQMHDFRCFLSSPVSIAADRIYAAVNTAGKTKTLAVIVSAPEEKFPEIEQKILSNKQFQELNMPLELLPFEPLKDQLWQIGCGSVYHAPRAFCGSSEFGSDENHFNIITLLDEDERIAVCQFQLLSSSNSWYYFEQDTVMLLSKFLYDTYGEESFILGLTRLISEELEEYSPFVVEKNFMSHLRNLGGVFRIID